MSAVIKGSVALAVLVWIASVIFAVTGMHRASPLLGIFLLVVLIVLNVLCIYWTLNQTAADNGYGKQLLNVIVFGVIASVLIFGASVLNLKVLFPDYLEENTTAMIEFLEGMDMPEDTLQAQIASVEGRTAVGESVKGIFGTFFTSLIVGAIVAIFKRKK